MYILIFSVNGTINIILHDLINLYAKIKKSDHYMTAEIFLLAIYKIKNATF